MRKKLLEKIYYAASTYPAFYFAFAICADASVSSCQLLAPPTNYIDKKSHCKVV